MGGRAGAPPRLIPEWGPGWHLGVLPLEDGGTAVSLVVSHPIVDGIGFGQAIADAAEGKTHDLGYPPAGSRTRRRALREDLRQTVKDLPDMAQAVAAMARRAWPDRNEFTSSIKAAPASPKTSERRSCGGGTCPDRIHRPERMGCSRENAWCKQ